MKLTREELIYALSMILMVAFMLLVAPWVFKFLFNYWSFIEAQPDWFK